MTQASDYSKGIDILLPVYNEEKFLESCLSSILSQSFPNWKVYAIDDFSTDNSLKILEEYASSEERIQIVKKNDQGIIPSLRAAFELSNSEAVTRMDADDLMPPQKLDKLYQTLKSSPKKSIITGKVKYFSDDTLENGFIKYQDWLNSLVDHNNHFAHIYKECVIPSACWIAYRSELHKINAFRESRYPEDYDLVFKWYEHNFHVYSIPEILHLWRDHPNRASRNDQHYADQKFFDLKIDYFLKLDWDERKQLILWGAGKKGKELARKLIERDVEFLWISNNPKKIGKSIYGKKIFPPSQFIEIPNLQVLVSISAQKFQKQKNILYDKYKLPATDLYEFL